MIERTHISMDCEMLNKINQVAEQNGVPFSELVRLACAYVIDNNVDVYQKSHKKQDDLKKATYNLKARLINRFGTLAEASRQLDIRYHTLIMYCSGKFKPSDAVVSKLLKVLN